MMTDVLFLAYWALSALNLIGIIHIPPDAMYSDYTQPRVVAWNWSFLPVDIVFSCLGLSAVAASRRGYAIWRPLALLSLAFTIAAGGMAISYWIILSEYNLSWFLPNLALVIWPLFFLPSLVRDTQESRS
tara:strand:+ start:32757 stop:33146 length:390 start_codon:yes stop_codon:yes gene_type:complete